MQNAAKLKKKTTKKVETKVWYSNPFILTTSNFKKQLQRIIGLNQTEEHRPHSQKHRTSSARHTCTTLTLPLSR